MGVFIGTVIACACWVLGFFLGSISTLDDIKAGRLEEDGFSYSYFDNVRKRHEMGRV